MMIVDINIWRPISTELSSAEKAEILDSNVADNKLGFSLSYQDIEEILKDRGIGVDHATIQRWVIKYTPELEKKFHRMKRSIGNSRRLNETYIKTKGKWTYYYRAVDKQRNTIDFYLSERRNKTAAKPAVYQC